VPWRLLKHWLGGGEMGELIRPMDWTQTALGPIESLPKSLRTTISLCLISNSPILLVWDPSMYRSITMPEWKQTWLPTGMRPSVAITITQLGLTLGKMRTALTVDRAFDILRDQRKEIRLCSSRLLGPRTAESNLSDQNCEPRAHRFVAIRRQTRRSANAVRWM